MIALELIIIIGCIWMVIVEEEGLYTYALRKKAERLCKKYL